MQFIRVGFITCYLRRKITQEESEILLHICLKFQAPNDFSSLPCFTSRVTVSERNKGLLVTLYSSIKKMFWKVLEQGRFFATFRAVVKYLYEKRKIAWTPYTLIVFLWLFARSTGQDHAHPRLQKRIQSVFIESFILHHTIKQTAKTFTFTVLAENIWWPQGEWVSLNLLSLFSWTSILFNILQSNLPLNSFQGAKLDLLLYIADNMAHFPYSIQEEPLFVIYHIDTVLSVTGANLLHSFKEVGTLDNSEF